MVTFWDHFMSVNGSQRVDFSREVVAVLILRCKACFHLELDSIVAQRNVVVGWRSWQCCEARLELFITRVRHRRCCYQQTVGRCLRWRARANDPLDNLTDGEDHLNRGSQQKSRDEESAVVVFGECVLLEVGAQRNADEQCETELRLGHSLEEVVDRLFVRPGEEHIPEEEAGDASSAKSLERGALQQ